MSAESHPYPCLLTEAVNLPKASVLFETKNGVCRNQGLLLSEFLRKRKGEERRLGAVARLL